MSSSDSDDDCYGNAASKLNKLKNRFKEDRFETHNLLNDSEEIDLIVQNNPVTSKPTRNSSLNSSIGSLDSDANISLASTEVGPSKNSPKGNRRVTRASRKKAATESISEDISAPSRPKRGRKSNTTSNMTPNTDSTNSTPVGINVSNDSVSMDNPAPETSIVGRRGRGRRQKTIEEAFQNPSPRRGRGRRRGASRPSLAQTILQSSLSNIPTYSVGNTSEYPDQCESQELFSSKPKPAVEVIEIDAEEEDVNEELSVKVYWQNAEVFKFTVRKYQKFTQIFDYFSNKASVVHGNLLFTYDGRILSVNDTPDSIRYNVSKFIDGGVAANSVSHAKHEVKIVNGIKIKFQCQSSRKPYEVVIGLDSKLSLAMTMCAEHFELNADKLRFYFDGEIVNGKQTPRDLDFEGGECIDVKTVS